MVLKASKYDIKNHSQNSLLRLSKLYYRICGKNYIFILKLKLKLEDVREFGSRDTYLRILLSLFTYRSEFSLLRNQNKFFDF